MLYTLTRNDILSGIQCIKLPFHLAKETQLFILFFKTSTLPFIHFKKEESGVQD